MNRHRLTWEESRDALSALSGMMIQRIGGKSVDPLASDQASLARRSLYTTIDRQYLPMTLQNFDFANPDMHNPKRSETVVPQQALFLLNHPLPAQAARSLVGWIERAEGMEASKRSDSSRLSDEDFITALHRRVLQRTPSPYEMELALEFLGHENQHSDPKVLTPREQLAQVLLIGNETIYID
jgi:hypothetical protein